MRHALAILLLATVAAHAQTAAPKHEQECREHLQTLGYGFTRYLLHHDGRPPARISELYTGGYVPDLDTFTCPASSTRIASAAQIDALSDYSLAREISGERPLLLVRDKAGFHGGQALAFYSDRTFKKTSAPPPANLAATLPATNPTPAAATNSAGTSLALTNPLQQSLAFDFLGRQHARNGRWTEAEAAFREAAQRDPTSTWHPYNLAYALSQQGRWKEAEAPSREALRLQPTNVLARVMLGHALGYQSNWTGAEAAFRTAAGLEPNNPQFRLELAHACVAQGKWKEAEGAYREVLRLDPNNAWANGGLGHVSMGQSRLAEAETSYRVAIKLSPNFAQFHADLGGTLLRLRRRDEALAAAQQGIRLGCRQHWVYRELGLNP